MTILGHPTHSDAPGHRCWYVFGTSQDPSRKAAIFNKSHAKRCPKKLPKKNRSWCDELNRVTLVPSWKHIFLASLRQLSKLLIRGHPLSRGAQKSQVPVATPTHVWHFLGNVAHASMWSRNCLSSEHLWRSATVWVRPILSGSERQLIWVPVDHCVCGAQLQALPHMVKLLAKP